MNRTKREEYEIFEKKYIGKISSSFEKIFNEKTELIENSHYLKEIKAHKFLSLKLIFSLKESKLTKKLFNSLVKTYRFEMDKFVRSNIVYTIANRFINIIDRELIGNFLIECLKDSEEHVRVISLYTLAQLNYGKAKKNILNLFYNETDPVILNTIIYSLSSLKIKNKAAILLNCFKYLYLYNNQITDSIKLHLQNAIVKELLNATYKKDLSLTEIMAIFDDINSDIDGIFRDKFISILDLINYHKFLEKIEYKIKSKKLVLKEAKTFSSFIYFVEKNYNMKLFNVSKKIIEYFPLNLEIINKNLKLMKKKYPIKTAEFLVKLINSNSIPLTTKVTMILNIKDIKEFNEVDGLIDLMTKKTKYISNKLKLSRELKKATDDDIYKFETQIQKENFSDYFLKNGKNRYKLSKFIYNNIEKYYMFLAITIEELDSRNVCMNFRKIINSAKYEVAKKYAIIKLGDHGENECINFLEDIKVNQLKFKNIIDDAIFEIKSRQ